MRKSRRSMPARTNPFSSEAGSRVGAAEVIADSVRRDAARPFSSAQVQCWTSKWLGQAFSPGHSLSSARLSARTPRACVIAISALHPGFRQGREGAHACLMPTGGLNLQNVGNGFRRVASRVAANTTAGAKRGDFQPITNLTRNSLPGFERLDTHRDWHPDYRLSIGDYESLAHG